MEVKSDSLEDKCRGECLDNCSCMAYAYDSGGIGCMLWSGDLIDIQKLSSGGVDLYIRVPPLKLKNDSDKKRHKRFIIPVGVSIGMITLAGCVYLSWKWTTAKPTGTIVVLRGRGSGNNECLNEEDGQQPLHLFLSSNNAKSLEDAKCLAENLLDTICTECGASSEFLAHY